MAEETKDIGVQREKFWKELTDAEKIERMREVVKSLESRIANLNTEVTVQREHTHQHGQVWYPHPSSFASYESRRSIGEWF